MTVETRETNSEPQAGLPPSPVFLLAMVLVMGPLGTGMVMQGLGSPVMDWLHPNPGVPRLGFLLLGLFVLACTVLMLAQLVRLPQAAVTAVGVLTMIMGLAVFNWMVFDGGGQATCFIGPFPSFMFGSLGAAVCGFVVKSGVVLIDLVAVLCIVALLRRRPGG